MSGYLARFKTEFASDLATDKSDSSCQKLSDPNQLSPIGTTVRDTNPIISFQAFTLDDAGKVIDLVKLRKAGLAAGIEPTSENLRRWAYKALCATSGENE